MALLGTTPDRSTHMIEFKFCGYIEFEYTNYKSEHETRRLDPNYDLQTP
jgi:hypothetical protein